MRCCGSARLRRNNQWRANNNYSRDQNSAACEYPKHDQNLSFQDALSSILAVTNKIQPRSRGERDEALVAGEGMCKRLCGKGPQVRMRSLIMVPHARWRMIFLPVGEKHSWWLRDYQQAYAVVVQSARDARGRVFRLVLAEFRAFSWSLAPAPIL